MPRAPAWRENAEVDAHLGVRPREREARGDREAAARLQGGRPADADVEAVQEVEFDLERPAALAARITGRRLGDCGDDAGAAREGAVGVVARGRARLDLVERIPDTDHLAGGGEAGLSFRVFRALDAERLAVVQIETSDGLVPAERGRAVVCRGGRRERERSGEQRGKEEASGR